MKTFLGGQFPSTLALVTVASIFVARLGAQTATPFNGFRFGLPATIECEQFDNGGPGLGFYDTDSVNTGGKYRNEYGNEYVDIYRCADYGGARGYCVGKTWPGEWLQYSITNSETATYQIKVVAKIAPLASSESKFHIEVDGVNATGPMTVWNYNDNWQTLYGTASMASGLHALKLVIDSGDPTYGAGLFDYITIYKMPPSISNPANSVPAQLAAGTGVVTAKNNGIALQTAFNSLPSTGGTVILPFGTYYICQPNPQETYPDPIGPISLSTTIIFRGQRQLKITSAAG